MRMTVREGANYARGERSTSPKVGSASNRDRLSLGADVVVRIEGLPPEPAVVRWRNGDCYGLGFNRFLSVTSLAAWLKEHQASGTPRKR